MGAEYFLMYSSNVRVINCNFVNNTTSNATRGYNVQYYNINNVTNRPRFINCIVLGCQITQFIMSLTTPQSSDFINCAYAGYYPLPASAYTNCISSQCDQILILTGPNFIAIDGSDWSINSFLHAVMPVNSYQELPYHF